MVLSSGWRWTVRVIAHTTMPTHSSVAHCLMHRADERSDPFGIPLSPAATESAVRESASSSKRELRVIGSAERWDFSGVEPRMVSKSRFSMVKLEVDRTKLTPTIKPFSREVDPEEIKKEQEFLRQKDKDEADDLRDLLIEVRRLKAEGVTDWQDRLSPPTEDEME